MNIGATTIAKSDSNFLGFIQTSRERKLKPVIPYGDMPAGNAEIPKILAGTVKVRSNTSWVHVGKGSGFLISPDGLCLTAAHVIYGKPICVKPMADSCDDQEIRAEIINISDSEDLALLKLDSNETPNHLTFSQDTLNRGDFVFSLGRNGFTSGQLLVDSSEKGTWTHAFVHSYDSIVSTNSTSEGDSGCALTNSTGKIVGLVVSGGGAGCGLLSSSVIRVLSGIERFCGSGITPFKKTACSVPAQKILDFLYKAKVDVDSLLRGEIGDKP